MLTFRITARDRTSLARTGLIKTTHGLIQTPAFVPVATKAALRGLSLKQAQTYGAQIFMANTYHLFCSDQYKIIGKLGGLRSFTGSTAPFMTDSGGFQVFSLGFGREHGVGKIADIFPDEAKHAVAGVLGKNLARIDDKGVSFTSVRDGRRLRLTPKISMQIQQQLGADIIFAFDECTSPLASYDYTKQALERTHRWAKECIKFNERTTLRQAQGKQVLFGIVQGGAYRDLRETSARFLGALPFAGFGIGGSLGKSKAEMHQVLDWTIPLLPETKPRHLLGIGEVPDIFEAVERGIDTFDCVIPTRWARHGTALTNRGRLNIAATKFRSDPKPLDANCSCAVCKNFSRAYVAHLLREKELYGVMLLAEHNLAWILNLMTQIRQAIKTNTLSKLKRHLCKYY